MNATKFGLMAIAALLIGTATPASAWYEGPAQMTIGAGAFDVLDDDSDPQVMLEYRGATWGYGLRPVAGVQATTDASLYGYGGVNWDLNLYDGLMLTPNLAVGAYHEGSGKDLGSVLQFRSGLELGYEFDNASRVGVTFNHLSNASLDDTNPGAESLMLLYSHPVDGFSW